jgi:hypothetical protein
VKNQQINNWISAKCPSSKGFIRRLDNLIRACHAIVTAEPFVNTRSSGPLRTRLPQGARCRSVRGCHSEAPSRPL